MYIYLPPAQAGRFFKLSLIGLNSAFSFKTVLYSELLIFVI